MATATVVLNQSIDKLEVEFSVDVSSFTTYTIILKHTESGIIVPLDALLSSTNTAIYQAVDVNVLNQIGEWRCYGKVNQGTTREIQSYESFIITVVNPGGLA